ncbi:helix-turn-helix transcriptional regulator [Flavobacterium sp. xlx-214]|uniref:helix-turn-helix transcriptional regulator n=1 Tax=unclassified Flavobacterium TaxID=196869 RepID=UPI0013D433E8|nr:MULTISPECIES: helix-turn-helix transcriptional regulator [unclassified Flavobacterium]MBA5792948.1 helix-turn-helix transcriptional regulator [Flavobacterium sp. xlx-221]QMI84718.1 helix-turn-helix transcriptional regulator [Flavobacterium sp. xlx-214]
MKTKIKVFRAMQNITQADLAEKLNVTRQTINAIEAGKYAPSVELALRMSKLFGVSVNEIFQLDDE